MILPIAAGREQVSFPRPVARCSPPLSRRGHALAPGVSKAVQQHLARWRPALLAGHQSPQWLRWALTTFAPAAGRPRPPPAGHPPGGRAAAGGGSQRADAALRRPRRAPAAQACRGGCPRVHELPARGAAPAGLRAGLRNNLLEEPIACWLDLRGCPAAPTQACRLKPPPGRCQSRGLHPPLGSHMPARRST